MHIMLLRGSFSPRIYVCQSKSRGPPSFGSCSYSNSKLYLFELGIVTLTRPIRFEAILIEEIELPRPHYKARLSVHIFRDPASATVNLIPDEIVLTVRVSP